MKPIIRVAVLAPLTLAATIACQTLTVDLNVTRAGDEDELLLTSLNGDHDGSGSYSVGDAIHLLNWLFLDGPDLAILGSVPATGQEACYDAIASIDCGDDDYPGQDGDVQAGCAFDERFIDNGDGTVTDKCTGLTWQQETALPGKDYDAEEHGAVTWANALAYCDELSLGGKSDWRLPNINELLSIIDWTRDTLGEPALDTAFPAADLPDGVEPRYWSSTTQAFLSNLVWTVDYGGGTDEFGDDQPPSGLNGPAEKLFDINLVRAVRGGD